MQSTHEGELDLPSIPKAARKVHIVPDLEQGNGTLLSVGQLCDSGCIANFTKSNVTITYNDHIVLVGHRTVPHGLWHLSPPTADQANGPTRLTRPSSLPASTKSADIVAWHHASLGSPTVSRLLKALDKGYLHGFPGLTSRTVRNHPPFSAATVKGHQDRVRKNLQSTKPTPDARRTDSDFIDVFHDDIPFPSSDSPNTRSHQCFVAVRDQKGKTYSDLPGKFPIPSISGNIYMVLVYDYDSNHIFAEPINSKHGTAILNGFKKVHKKLLQAGLTPKFHVLDNEASTALKEYLRASDIDFQLAPPHEHRRNLAERAIRTFKNHFIAFLSSLDPDFPAILWDRILFQALLTLNLLRGSRVNPKLSAQAQVYGIYDYNRTPIAPPGVRVLVHEPAATRNAWSPHATDAWYIGPAMDSYRCHRVWVPDTRKERIAEQVTWYPTRVHAPVPTAKDEVKAAITALGEAITRTDADRDLHFLTDTQLQSMQTLANTVANRDSSATTDATKPADNPDPSPRVPSESDAAQPPRVGQPLPDTYAGITGFHGMKTRAAARKQAKDNTQPSPATTTSNRPPYPPPAPSALAPRRYSALSLVDETVPIFDINNNALPRPLAHNFLDAVFDDDGDTTAYLHYCNKAVNPDTGKLAEYAELRKSSQGLVWEHSCALELGRLAQGLHPELKNGNDTIRFIFQHEVPKHKTVTYLRIVSNYRPQKELKERIRFTVGGDRLRYDGPTSANTADLTTMKILINAILSTKGARAIGIDLKDFYLKTRLEEPEYMRIHASLIPDRIMEQYNLHEKVAKDGYVYVEINGGMYGLKQAGIIANKALKKRLLKHDYYECEHTPGLFKHKTRHIFFGLVVDDFLAGYVGKDNAEHLLNILREHYDASVDWRCERFLGITMKWDYDNGTCDLSMPGYVQAALQRFEHPEPTRPQDSPYPWLKPNYGAKTQLPTPNDDSAPLDLAARTRIQEIVGTLLFYCRAVDNTMATALSTLASEQAQGTERTLANVCHLLNYAASHPDAVCRFRASDMCLWIHSDGSYLSEPKARSRWAGYFFLSDKPVDPTKAPQPGDPPPMLNGPILFPTHALKEVTASAAETELAGIFHNAREGEPIRTTLEELGFPQGPTPLQTDNTTAFGIANDTVKQRKSKAMDMRYYWVRDRIKQGHYHVYWDDGKGNRADYYTKHHPASHHRAVRPIYLHEPHHSAVVRGCVDPAVPPHPGPPDPRQHDVDFSRQSPNSDAHHWPSPWDQDGVDGQGTPNSGANMS